MITTRIKGAIKNVVYCLLCLYSVTIVACINTEQQDASMPNNDRPPTDLIEYAVAGRFPHDTSLFTEGLVFYNDQLYESTGSPGNLPAARSLIGAVDLGSGKMSIKAELDKRIYFGEGIVFLDNKAYQLTYKNQVGFIYDALSFTKIDSFNYSSPEGWGMTTDKHSLIMSDGTDELTFLDPSTLKVQKKLKVLDKGSPLDKLNELEYVKGYIYANVWEEDYIVKVDPVTGAVVGRIDLTSLVLEAKSLNPAADVLNGIAYDESKDQVYITGKLWPNIYQVSFNH
ncbi:MAG: glutaminyl-peptide cyclotransferase [Chitinophagaceae bacterium]|nr:MAG: glutaminyl-peptide cyclotransferase [Chitinophagaceae bacterium]